MLHGALCEKINICRIEKSSKHLILKHEMKVSVSSQLAAAFFHLEKVKTLFANLNANFPRSCESLKSKIMTLTCLSGCTFLFSRISISMLSKIEIIDTKCFSDSQFLLRHVNRIRSLYENSCASWRFAF